MSDRRTATIERVDPGYGVRVQYRVRLHDPDGRVVLTATTFSRSAATRAAHALPRATTTRDMIAALEPTICE